MFIRRMLRDFMLLVSLSKPTAFWIHDFTKDRLWRWALSVCTNTSILNFRNIKNKNITHIKEHKVYLLLNSHLYLPGSLFFSSLFLHLHGVLLKIKNTVQFTVKNKQNINIENKETAFFPICILTNFVQLLPDGAGLSRLLIRVPQKPNRFRLMSSESLRSSICTECQTPLMRKTKHGFNLVIQCSQLIITFQ